MTDRQIELLAITLWQKHVSSYKPQSSSGYLISGKRKTDLEQTFFFWELTFGKPEERIKEWKDREEKFNMICADTIFGEKFSHALLDCIRIKREGVFNEKENRQEMEVEWFTMKTLSWINLKAIMTEICIFVHTIKNIKGIVPKDINAISLNEIKTLPKIGNKLAGYIFEKRIEKPFTDFNDMKKRVPKIGDRIINAFREFIVFGQNQNLDLDQQLININTASPDMLKELPKIGKVLSENIIRQREKQPFVTKEDIMLSHGVGPKTFDNIKDLITV